VNSLVNILNMRKRTVWIT